MNADTTDTTVAAEPAVTFESLGLCPDLLHELDVAGFVRPTPIQASAIPAVLSGGDVVGVAQTGTGKTAAFLLPIMQRLSPDEAVAALVLSPTRELAEQTHTFALQFGRTKGIKSALVIGGEAYRLQERALDERPGIVVGTPGRLLDQMQRGRLVTRAIRYVVMDEADRLLDMGFAPQIEDVFRHLPRERQTLLFSATMPPRVQALARAYQKDPVEVAVGPRHKAVERCAQELYVVTEREKALLVQYLARREEGSMLVFTRTRRGADELYRLLRRSRHAVAVLHADRIQEERRAALEDFRTGRMRILVATDIAARGLDVEGIARVVNYDVPPTVEDYLHRIGRTARAEREGHASTLATIEDLNALRSIEAGLEKKIPSVVIPRAELNAFLRDEAAREFREPPPPPEEPHRRPFRSGGQRRSGNQRGRSRR